MQDFYCHFGCILSVLPPISVFNKLAKLLVDLVPLDFTVVVPSYSPIIAFTLVYPIISIIITDREYGQNKLVIQQFGINIVSLSKICVPSIINAAQYCNSVLNKIAHC